jgi:Protein of unknown function (DUF3089)
VGNLRRIVITIAVLAGVGLPTAGVAGAATTSSTTAPSAWPATVWLCRPGQASDPCTPKLTTTRVSFHHGGRSVIKSKPAAHPSIDCFYVYPTVSDQKTPNANLTVDPQEVSIAHFQAAMFSRVCRVYAPMYRQLTLSNISGAATPAEEALAYGDVLHAWRTYLRKYNHGRGVVLIGHSQGSFLLRQLISTQIDPSARVRRHLVSAVLLGGNVTVKKGKGIGGDFHHIPACRSASQTGCVIAYSTFGSTPPADSVFGRTSTPGLQILCTNPAALRGGTGTLDPILPARPFDPGSTIAAGISLLHFSIPHASTPYLSAPGAYTARCSTAGGASFLRITAVGSAPVLHPSPLPTWGLHLVDINIALGNLVAVVGHEAAAYHRPG